MRLADSGVARVECSSNRVSKGLPFDTEQFPNVLHLKNGEVIPCQVSSYDEQTLGFQSPFIIGRKIDSPFVRGIEFKPSRRPDPKEEPSSELDRWLNEIRVAEQKTSFGIDLVKLERVLTVPRFNRDNPPSHLLVANTGDLKRGKLLGINGQTIQFDSKLRKLTIPINRVAQVVGVGKPEENPDSRQLLSIVPEPQMQKLPAIKPVVVNDAPGVTGCVRVTLADGSILVFEPLESKDGKLLGRSPIYGEIAVPVKSIHHLHFGDDEADSFKSVFAEWVGRPGKEPEFGDDQ